MHTEESLQDLNHTDGFESAALKVIKEKTKANRLTQPRKSILVRSS